MMLSCGIMRLCPLRGRISLLACSQQRMAVIVQRKSFGTVVAGRQPPSIEHPSSSQHVTSWKGVVTRRSLQTSRLALADTTAEEDSDDSDDSSDDETAKESSGVLKTEVRLQELIKLLDTGNIRLIDVREPHEIHETGSIPTSKNIPVSQLKSALALTDAEFLQTFEMQKPRLDDADVVYYGLSSENSAAAVDIAQKMGFTKARHYAGGWEEWSVKCRSEFLV